MIRKLAGLPGVHVAIAFLAMGGWAIYANRSHALPAPVIAGLVQGAISGAITLGLKRALDAMRASFSRQRGWWLPPLVACGVSFCMLVAIHLVTGTPEVIRTISLPFSVASTYAVTYNLIMWRKGSTG